MWFSHFLMTKVLISSSASWLFFSKNFNFSDFLHNLLVFSNQLFTFINNFISLKLKIRTIHKKLIIFNNFYYLNFILHSLFFLRHKFLLGTFHKFFSLDLLIFSKIMTFLFKKNFIFYLSSHNSRFISFFIIKLFLHFYIIKKCKMDVIIYFINANFSQKYSLHQFIDFFLN